MYLYSQMFKIQKRTKVTFSDFLYYILIMRTEQHQAEAGLDLKVAGLDLKVAKAVVSPILETLQVSSGMKSQQLS